MPPSVRFKANRPGITALAVSPGARKAALSEAEKGKGIAEGLAQEFRRTGTYAASFSVSEATVFIAGLPRAGARLENTAGHAAAVELGNASTNGDGHHVLSRTLDALRSA